MKKVIIMLMLLLSLTPVMSQSRGFSTSRYYDQRYSIQDIAIGQIYYRWDAWGNQHAFQQYKRARWYSQSGGCNTYYWNNGRWRQNWSNSRSYYYDWVYYTKQLW